MRITKILFLLFIFQVILMAASLTYNIDVIYVVSMILYVSFLILVGSLITEKSNSQQYQRQVSSNALSKILSISLILSFVLFLAKVILYYPEIDYSSYSAIRSSFLFSTHGIIGILLSLSLWVGLILAGSLFAKKMEESDGGLVNSEFFYIFIALLFGVSMTGSRSVIFLFAAAYIAMSSSVFSILRNKNGRYILLFVVLLLIALGLLRGIQLNHILTPFDSFLVGPHLLHENIDTIISQRESLISSGALIPPGYALFSGFYVFLNIVLSYVGIDVFSNHLEAWFWNRHEFVYIPAFGTKYNSYYTVGLAVVIEGWFMVGVMSVMLGMIPHFIKNKYFKVVVLSALFYFSLSLYSYSVFQNYALGFLFIIVIILDYLCRIPYYKIARKK